MEIAKVVKYVYKKAVSQYVCQYSVYLNNIV